MQAQLYRRRSEPADANQFFDHKERDPRASRDVPPGENWAFVEHRSMAEIIGAEVQQ